MAILDGRLPRRAGVHRVVANPVLRPSFRALAGSHFSPQNRGPTGPGGSAHSKVPLCRERRMQGYATRLGAIMTKGVPRARSLVRSGLPETLSTSTMRILAPVGCYERQRRRVHRFPVSAHSWAPGCTTARVSYRYLKAPARLGKELKNLGTLQGQRKSRNGPATAQPIPCRVR
jgi:hypothetical protein